MQSVAERLALLPTTERDAALDLLSEDEKASLLHDWRGFMARPEQLAPDGPWQTWLVMAGRGFGKTEAGAQWVRERVADGARSIALVAETQKDLEEVMVPRLVSIYPAGEAPTVRFKPVRVRWPNGAIALGYNGTEPDQLRGPEFDTAWVDELAKYRYARDAWDMLQFTMRAGSDPRVCVTTTPRPIPVVREIIADAGTVVTRGSTFDNASNLAPTFLKAITGKYEGTRLGRQEINAEVLDDIPGALWTRDTLDKCRRRQMPKFRRVLVSVDPAITSGETADEHGIIVGGSDDDSHGWVLEDASLQGSPLDWARRAIAKHDEYEADGIVVEVNQGGEMVAHTLRSVRPNIRVIEVRATRGKHVRAEPVSALYEQGRISHLGAFPELEDQMVLMTSEGYMGERSPDRLDALVWLFTELFPSILRRPDVEEDDYEEAYGRSDVTGY